MIINSQKEMVDFAVQIAEKSNIGDIIVLKGTLGAGKSFFARHFINALQDEPCEVLSPTFNLVYGYETKKGEVSHFDLYRLKDASELENIGFFDAVKNGICVIEWPEIAAQFLTKNVTQIDITIRKDLGEEAREIVVTQQ